MSCKDSAKPSAHAPSKYPTGGKHILRGERAECHLGSHNTAAAIATAWTKIRTGLYFGEVDRPTRYQHKIGHSDRLISVNPGSTRTRQCVRQVALRARESSWVMLSALLD